MAPREVSWASATASDQLQRVFPQSTPIPWRGNEGANADVVTVNYGIVRVSLRKDKGLWWADASAAKGFDHVELFASSAAEAANKIKAELLK